MEFQQILGLLDSSGNSISSSIKNVREVMGIYSLDKVFEPFEEYEIKK